MPFRHDCYWETVVVAVVHCTGKSGLSVHCTLNFALTHAEHFCSVPNAMKELFNTQMSGHACCMTSEVHALPGNTCLNKAAGGAPFQTLKGKWHCNKVSQETAHEGGWLSSPSSLRVAYQVGHLGHKPVLCFEHSLQLSVPVCRSSSLSHQKMAHTWMMHHMVPLHQHMGSEGHCNSGRRGALPAY